MVARKTRYYTVRRNICGFSAWELLHITLLTPSVLRWRLDFLKLLDPYLMVSYEVTGNLGVAELKKQLFYNYAAGNVHVSAIQHRSLR
jgi:hypothetical protein